MEPTVEDPIPSVELHIVHWNRHREALAAGLTDLEARMFAESRVDIGQLRKLVAAGCPVELIREIVL